MQPEVEDNGGLELKGLSGDGGKENSEGGRGMWWCRHKKPLAEQLWLRTA